MFQPDQDGVYAVVAASPVRRIVASSVLFLLGAMIVYIGLLPPIKAFLTPALVLLGLAILYLCDKLRRATQGQIMLTDAGVVTQDGTVLAQMDEIVAVDRGAFAMKPSNGFTLKLTTKQPRGWAPGLWWRLGRRVGVGGATSAGQSKFMAEQIALRIAARGAS